MSMTKGTPESSQIIWLTQRVEQLEAELEEQCRAVERSVREECSTFCERSVDLKGLESDPRLRDFAAALLMSLAECLRRGEE